MIPRHLLRLSTKVTPSSLRTIGQRRWASTKPTSETTQEETFGNNIWRNTVLLAIAGVIWYRIDERITDQGDEKHPFTNWIEYHMNKSHENDQFAEAHLENAKKIAEYKLIYQDAQRPPIYRIRYPEAFERSSPRAIVAGNNCDISDVNIRGIND